VQIRCRNTKKAVSKIGNGSILLVIPARIELATYRLGGGCSILLSYGTITTAQAELKPFHPSCIKYYTAKTKYWQ
jgi:hypothetical protein